MDEEQVRELRSRLAAADDMLREITEQNDRLESENRELNASRKDWKACAIGLAKELHDRKQPGNRFDPADCGATVAGGVVVTYAIRW